MAWSPEQAAYFSNKRRVNFNGKGCTPIERIKSRIVVTDVGCWMWTGNKMPPRVKHRGKEQAVRKLLAQWLESTPNTWCEDDSGKCCNPWHTRERWRLEPRGPAEWRFLNDVAWGRVVIHPGGCITGNPPSRDGVCDAMTAARYRSCETHGCRNPSHGLSEEQAKRRAEDRLIAEYMKRGGLLECWPWTGPVDSQGYPSIGAAKHSGHRLLWMRSNPGRTPRIVRHVCRKYGASNDNKRCCNPAHLWEGSHADNMADMRADVDRVKWRQHIDADERAAIYQMHAGGMSYRAIREKTSRSIGSIREAIAKYNGGNHSEREWEALRRAANGICQSCGVDVGFAGLTKDHIKPIAKGGGNGIDNIRPVCKPCNLAHSVDNCASVRHNTNRGGRRPTHQGS